MSLFKNFNFNKLKDGLSKTRSKLVQSLNETVSGKAEVDETTLEEIEEILVTSDIGIDATEIIIDNARIDLASEKNRTNENIIRVVKDELVRILNKNRSENNPPDKKPYVIFIVGVNGAGKTTTVGKLANNYKSSGYKVIVGAADTFRAAANEQLEIWSDRAGVDLVQRKQGSDPSSVAYDAVKKAIDDKYDIVLIDTAGRLHSKTNLMKELDKIKRAMKKLVNDAPHETLLVLDGNTGQNALVQATEFSKVTDLTGLVITKLDGTAKGGVIFQISSRQKVPVKYIGVGEDIDDLQEFIPEQFVSALFDAVEKG